MRWVRLFRTAVLAVLFIVACNLALQKEVHARQQELAGQLIRFHVRANSDLANDQALKMKVKETVVSYMEELLKDSTDVQESEQRINAHMQDILMLAMNTIHEQGYEYDLSGYLVEEYFPLRVYGNIALPPGRYKAFRIDIGEAKGKNWWCVLYPPLCFVDITHGELSEENQKELEALMVEEDFLPLETCELEFKYLKFLNKWVK